MSKRNNTTMENSNGKNAGKRKQIKFDTAREAFKLLDSRLEMYQQQIEAVFEDEIEMEFLPAEMVFLCEFLDLDAKQMLVLLSVLKDSLKGRFSDLDDITGKLNLNIMTAFDIHSVCNELLLKNYFISERGHGPGSIRYAIAGRLLTAIRENNNNALPVPLEITSWEKFAHELSNRLNDCVRHDNSPEDTWENLLFFKHITSKYTFWEEMDGLEVEERIFLLLALRSYFYKDNVCQLSDDRNEILWNGNSRVYKHSLKSQITEFACYKDGYFEIIQDELQEDNEEDVVISLTQKGQHFFFGDEEVKSFSKSRSVKLNLLKPETIRETRLYYDSDINNDIATLEKVLGTEQLDQFFRKMEMRNLPQCISVLFVGGPGTGKTETAMQLARKTGRPIMKVDLSSIKDKYVGESEKNVKTIFKDYAHAVRNSEIMPILMLNEADGLLGKRMDVKSGVDQMLNTMQNILLEQMETMKGIIIATTNLRNNLDYAFDRRFNFKITFPEPGEEPRQKIWKTLLPELPETWHEQLAKKHKLTGGQIRNVVYRYFVEESLGHEPDYKLLEDLANNESPKNALIGFKG